jgi:SAM-dependent methyltransferase
VPHDDPHDEQPHDEQPHDRTGKVSFDHVYTAEDPRPYFRTLRALDYRIPDLARAPFARLLDEYRQVTGVAVPAVLDIGCSYGVNAALLRCGVTLDELYERYGDAADGRSRADLLATDRELVRARAAGAAARFTGLDTSPAAVGYAVAAGFLDDAVTADLESGELSDVQRRQLAGTDLVISTGCIGYVTEKTLLRIVDAVGERRPWMAHFCLRMFPYDTIAGQLDDLGYETVRVGEPFRQRRFASAQERANVLERLSALGLPEAGEADGWLYAQLHMSRPAQGG